MERIEVAMTSVVPQTRTLIWPVAATVFAVALAGCAGPASLETTSGLIAGQGVTAGLDTPLARYYLAEYLTGPRTDPARDTLLTRVEHSLSNPPRADELQRIAAEHSPDLAGLMLARRLMEEPRNRALRSRYLDLVDEIERDRRLAVPVAYRTSGYRVLVVPGWFYRSYPGTGAALGAPRAAMREAGFASTLIETDENGAVEDNARAIARAILDARRGGERLILVSVSKAGPETAYALGALLDAGQSGHVHAWINVCGVLQGSPLADWALAGQADFWDEHFPVSAGSPSVVSLTTAQSRPRFARLTLPPHIQIVNVVGIPFAGTVSSRARKSFERLNSLGPNDGSALVLDQLAPGGLTLVEPGLDHFLRDAQLLAKLVAVLRVVSE
jgi:hypothetical protein